MPRRKRESTSSVEIFSSVILLIFALMTAWFSMINSAQMTVLTGLATATLAIAMVVSGRTPGV